MIQANVSLPSSMLLFCSSGSDDVKDVFSLLELFPFVFNFLLPLSSFFTSCLMDFFRFEDPTRVVSMIKKINYLFSNYPRIV